MRTIKIMGIIGIILACVSFMGITTFLNPIDYEAAGGWGIIACLYLLAQSIVGITRKADKSDSVSYSA